MLGLVRSLVTAPGEACRSAWLDLLGRKEASAVAFGHGSLQRLTARDLLMLWPADRGWPKDTGALAILDPIGADRRPATLR
jgi:hypothetical protein